MADIILQILINFIILPITLILATPLILVAGFFGKEKYLKRVKELYTKIYRWWKRVNF